MWTGEELEGANGWSWHCLPLIPFPCSKWDNLRYLLLSLMRVMEEAWLLFLIFLGTGSPFECSGNPLPMRKEGRKSKSLFLTCFGFFFFMGLGCFVGWFAKVGCIIVGFCATKLLNQGSWIWLLALHLLQGCAGKLCCCFPVVLCSHSALNWTLHCLYWVGERKDFPANSQKYSCFTIISLLLLSACPPVALTRGTAHW